MKTRRVDRVAFVLVLGMFLLGCVLPVAQAQQNGSSDKAKNSHEYCRVELIQVYEDAQGNCLKIEFSMEDCQTHFFGTIDEDCSVTTADPDGCHASGTDHCGNYSIAKSRHEIDIPDSTGTPVRRVMDLSIYQSGVDRKPRKVGDVKFGAAQQGARVFRVHFNVPGESNCRYADVRVATIPSSVFPYRREIATALEVARPTAKMINANKVKRVPNVNAVLVSFTFERVEHTCFVYLLDRS